MRFKAILNNPVGLYKIVQTLDKLGRSCIVTFTREEVRFTTYREDDSAIPAWVRMATTSVFSNYTLESRDNTIHFVTKTQDLQFALKNLQESSSIKLQLKTRDGKSFLDFTSTSESLYNTTSDETKELQILIMSSDKMALIKEPANLGPPDAYILLPSVSILKPAVDRFKAIGKYLIISASMDGKLKLELDSTAAKCKVFYENLTNPTMNGYVSTLEEGAFASVAIRAPCCKKWFDCSECHAEVSEHPLRKTNEMVFACKKCKKVFRKDMTDYEEEDEFCPHCDNQYVVDAVTPEARLKIDTGDTRIDSRVIKDDRLRAKEQITSIFDIDGSDMMG